MQQQALKDPAQAFTNFFLHPEHYRHPTFRKKRDGGGFRLVGQSYSLQQLNARWAELRIPKAGRVRLRLSRALPGGAGSCRVTLDPSGRWHASFPAPQPAVSRRPTGAAVGLDRGVAVSLATSDGDLLQAPNPTREQRRRLRWLRRRLARQLRGSKRRARTRHALARLKATERDQRKDWIEKTSTHLVRAYDVIVLEGLAVDQMTRSAKGTPERPGRNVRQKAGLNRRILDSGWGELAEGSGRRGRPRASSWSRSRRRSPARCAPVCRAVGRENRESQAVFHCQDCGHRAHADVNAAIVIRERGIQMLAPAAGHAVAARGADRVAEAVKREPATAAPAA